MSPDAPSRPAQDPAGLVESVAPDHNLDAVLTANVYCNLQDQGLLDVRGEDAGSFLQGQITQDIHRINASQSHLAAHCTSKGRMLALCRVIRQAEGYQLLMPRTQLPTLRKRLQLYVLRARVELGDDSDTTLCIGLGGPALETLLARHCLLPDTVDRVTANEGLRLIRVAGDPPRFLLLGETDAVSPVMAELAPQLTPVGTEAWRLRDILAGIPAVHPQTSDQFVPQMANLDILDGISLKKGCYTGQEIVARSHYLGKLKRRMFRLDLSDGHAAPGMAVVSEADPGQPAGMVVDSAPQPGGGEALLAVLRLEARDASLHLETPEGPVLQPAPLPYGIPQPER